MSVGRCPDHDSMSCSFQQGLCGYEQEQELDDLDWLWHDGKGDDDVFLPLETHWHFYYAYLNTSAPPVSSLKGWFCSFRELLNAALVVVCRVSFFHF